MSSISLVIALFLSTNCSFSEFKVSELSEPFPFPKSKPFFQNLINDCFKISTILLSIFPWNFLISVETSLSITFSTSDSVDDVSTAPSSSLKSAKFFLFFSCSSSNSEILIFEDFSFSSINEIFAPSSKNTLCWSSKSLRPSISFVLLTSLFEVKANLSPSSFSIPSSVLLFSFSADLSWFVNALISELIKNFESSFSFSLSFLYLVVKFASALSLLIDLFTSSSRSLSLSIFSEVLLILDSVSLFLSLYFVIPAASST